MNERAATQPSPTIRNQPQDGITRKASANSELGAPDRDRRVDDGSRAIAGSGAWPSSRWPQRRHQFQPETIASGPLDFGHGGLSKLRLATVPRDGFTS